VHLVMNRPVRGWLTNSGRRARRDRANTFTNLDALKLINKIDSIPAYVSTKLDSRFDKLLRLRDKALIATAWVWFKRAGEVLALRREDVALTDRELLVTFQIQKKQKRFKICFRCKTRNGVKSNYCRECKTDLRNVGVIQKGNSRIVTKRKTLRNKFTKYVVDWLLEFDKFTKKGWFFPALRVVFTSAYFDFNSINPMSIQNFDRILNRLDPKMTSCLFRYGGVEKYLVLGYNPHELKEIGDWSSSKMPEVYAERKGLTPALRKWSEDTR
jgi:integrase